LGHRKRSVHSRNERFLMREGDEGRGLLKRTRKRKKRGYQCF